MGLELDRSFIEVVEPVVLRHRFTIDPHQACGVFYAQLQEPPLAVLDARIESAFDRIQRPSGIVSTFHIVQLDLVVPPARSLAGRAKEHAAVVMPGVPDVHLQLEITELLEGSKM